MKVRCFKRDVYRLKKTFLIFALSLMILSSGCGKANTGSTAQSHIGESPAVSVKQTANPEAEATPAAKPQYIISVQLDSAAIANNLLEEPTKKSLYIYLPPSYYDKADKKYPVVYFLHGFAEGPGALVGQRNALDKVMKEDESKEFIIVEPTGSNKLSGSFYVNSEITGYWEDFITQEVVNYIDSNYRTIPNASSRGIAGFSMGGFGALNLAMKHPDIYSSVLAYSPGLIRDGHLNDAFKSWDKTFLNAYGAVFSPNTKIQSPYGNIPNFNGTDNDNKVIKNWESGFGDIEKKIDAYIALNKPLNGIKVVVGKSDSYKWIPDGCKAFSEIMQAKGQTMVLKEINGGHSIPFSTLKDDFINYFAGLLVKE